MQQSRVSQEQAVHGVIQKGMNFLHPKAGGTREQDKFPSSYFFHLFLTILTVSSLLASQIIVLAIVIICDLLWPRFQENFWFEAEG